MSGFVSGSGLRREEVTFTREEAGGSVGIQNYLESIKTDFSAHYDLPVLKCLRAGQRRTPQDVGASLTPGRRRLSLISTATNVIPRCSRSPVPNCSPGSEFAAEGFGGTVTYQRFIFGGAYNRGFAWRPAASLRCAPGRHIDNWRKSRRNCRSPSAFFPAVPTRCAAIRMVKRRHWMQTASNWARKPTRKATLNWNNWSLNPGPWWLFWMPLALRRTGRIISFDEGLYSVGGGIRWRSLIGPIRLEYGYNLHRREFDPVGTLHLSIGFPF